MAEKRRNFRQFCWEKQSKRPNPKGVRHSTLCTPLGVGVFEHFFPNNFPENAPFFVKNKVVGFVAKIGLFLQFGSPAGAGPSICTDL
jgi:hypothetical protein